VDDLVADRRNQRRPLDAELVASVAAHGVLEPILATPDAERPGTFRIVAGERRWRAARKAGLPTVPAIVRTLSEAEAAEIQLVENLARSDLSATQPGGIAAGATYGTARDP
jgi:ParB family transcriptional regulator, chromosome partitioning protein